jgi:hypothetical protein
MKKQRVILDAELDGSVIHGALTTPMGERREFHGWLELNTALEALLDTDATSGRPQLEPVRTPQSTRQRSDK